MKANLGRTWQDGYWLEKILLKEMSSYSHQCSSVALKGSPELGREKKATTHEL